VETMVLAMLEVFFDSKIHYDPCGYNFHEALSQLSSL